MSDIPVSVVVVSRDRPDALVRCLTGLSQLQYPNFEIVVVADPKGHRAVASSQFSSHIKSIRFDLPNISEARNLGISHAAGDIIAFIDDDAVPEPSWLTFLVAPSERPNVVAMGGYVRGRNGISFQWKARSVDAYGHSAPLNLNPARATLLTSTEHRAIKTEGTNMAVRRDVLVDLGGFDPGFAFYLDETDLNLRLMRAGHTTAVVPMAEVHHGFLESAQRRRDRVPRDLFEIGSSWAVFQRKYINEAERVAHWRAVRDSEWRRVVSHMVAGRLEPRDIRNLLGRLDLGYWQGLARKRGDGQVARSPLSAFKRYPMQSRISTVLSGRIRARARLQAEAAERVQSGEIVTVVCLSPSTRFHTVEFDSNGFWVQKGGTFGKSDRTDRMFRMTTFPKRVQREIKRIAQQRLIR